ncbi:MAG: hypothetical protein IH971_08885 [Candidatus Marinimicrobia bacterium]|nr:hypothetical protein [Candidatus Neomarinimicrobiota bacterium]
MKTHHLLAFGLAFCLASSAVNGQWATNGSDIYNTNSGEVGIGTTTPVARLEITGVTGKDGLRIGTSNVFELRFIGGGGANIYAEASEFYLLAGSGKKLHLGSNGTNSEVVLSSGNLGIGTSSPASALHIDFTNNWDGIRMKGYNTWDMAIHTSGDFYIGDVNMGKSVFWIEKGQEFNNRLYIKSNGNIGIGTSDPQELLDVNGTIKTKVIQITGGADLAEPFRVAGSDAIAPGTVVSIDPNHPGQLRVASRAYDRTVAGIISGAGGVNPGILMAQADSEADGDYPVALTGRLYAWADASTGPITPGDLLTTSDTPGHVMKVTDHDRAQGAIIGKAMSSLDEGRDLVLVLVALQ